MHRARAHEVIYREGDALTRFYVVQSGSFKLVRRSEARKELIVALVGAGGSFGAIVDPLVSETAAQALESSVYLTFPWASVRRILAENSAFALEMLVADDAGRREMEARAAQLVFETVPRRLARLLLDLSDVGTGELSFPLKQADLAHLIGSSRETVCAILNRFRREGSLWIQRGRISIRDRARLAAVK